MSRPHDPPRDLADTSYPVTYVRELSPGWLNYVAALHGVRPCPIDQRFDYLELGCGRGASTVRHAAVYPAGRFYGFDLDRRAIGWGRQHARERSVSNVFLRQLAFQDLAAARLPEFDFIVLHGVYTWIGPRDQAAIRGVIERTLKPGGLLYVGYNCLPGWASEIPLRRLLGELACSMDGPADERVVGAAKALGVLRGAGLSYLSQHPAAERAVDAYLRSPPGYLAHELLTEHWTPRFSIDVADEMSGAGVAYLGSARLVDNHPELLIGAETAAAVAALPTERQRQLVVDFAVNRQFRRDVFVRTERALVPASMFNPYLAQVIVALTDPSGVVPDKVHVPRGVVRFDTGFVDRLSGLMAAGPARLALLSGTLARSAGDHRAILRNLLYLVAAGVLCPVRPPGDGARSPD